MTVNEEMRHEVYDAFKASYGERVAGAIMEMMPPAGIPELATKADLAVLKADFDALQSEFGTLQGEFDAKFAGFRQEFDAKLEGVESRLGERIERGLREQGNRFITWMLGTAGVSVAAVGVFSRLG